MLIQRKQTDKITFDKIKKGDVFKYSDNYFLKTTCIHGYISSEDGDSIDGNYNAVYISTGKVAKFSDNLEVIKVDAKLIVNI